MVVAWVKGEETVGFWRKPNACSLKISEVQDWKKVMVLHLNLCSGQLRSQAPLGDIHSLMLMAYVHRMWQGEARRKS